MKRIFWAILFFLIAMGMLDAGYDLSVDHAEFAWQGILASVLKLGGLILFAAKVWPVWVGR